MELFDFMGFLCVCFPRKFVGLWVARDWVGLCVYGFVSWLYLWFGFLDFCFFFFVFLDLMEIGFGYWNWIWGLLVFNLIFSSFCLCSSDMGLSSWLCCCDLSSWLLGSCSCDV